MLDIINELNEENGSNYKLSVLKKYQNNETLKRVLKATYDRVTFTYGVSLKTIEKSMAQEPKNVASLTLEDALDFLEYQLSTRNITGNNAIESCRDVYSRLNHEDSVVFLRIIDRDLKINLGKTQINKVFPNLIVKPVYMRCAVFNDKNKKHITINEKTPAIIQLKSDGTYRDFSVQNGKVECSSRSGESYEYPLFDEVLTNYPDGHYHGEITVILDDVLFDKITPTIVKIDKKNGTNLLEEIAQKFNEYKSIGKEYILPRSVGNGLVNSDDIPHNNLILELWDFIEHDEYQNAKNKVKNKTPYTTRLERLESVLNTVDGVNVRMIPYHRVVSLREALTHVSEWMQDGFEGGVLKDAGMVFKDGTSNQQQKIKIEMDIEVRCIGYNEGTKGTKREGKIGSLKFSNDEGTIQGSCSGFSDAELDEFTENFEKYDGKVFTVQFNDLSKARGNSYYALSHPRFIEWRNDKDETDTLERTLEIREMAVSLV